MPIWDILKYAALCLAIAVSLFFTLASAFGWAHYYGWPWLITKTEAKLSGRWLQKYLNGHALLSFLYAVMFFLFFFDSLAELHFSSILLMAILTIRTELHFRNIANQNAAKD